jgi:hypothetical protein
VATGQMLLSPDIQDKLGRDGLAELAASLWPVDCQTCGRPLGPAPPALCVDDFGVFAGASLHHKQCRTPEWNQGVITGPGGAFVSHRSRLVMLPLSGGTSQDNLPTMLVNPSLESVFIHPADGTWRPQLPLEFAQAGMVPPGPQLRLFQPIAGVTARLTTNAITVTMPPPAISDVYECELTESDTSFYREVSSKRGIMLAATNAADPGSDDAARQLFDAMRADRVLCGWVALTHLAAG